MELIKNLNWRYATKEFDAMRVVESEKVELLKEAVRLSVSSYGLQLYEVMIVEDENVKHELMNASYGQKQIADCSHLFVFCNYTKVKDEYIDSFIGLTAKARDIDRDDMTAYGASMKRSLNAKGKTEQVKWLEKQPYLALSNLLMACAELQVDACPMEGFVAEEYNRILGLSEQGLNSCVIASVGYRSANDKAQFNPKVRKPMDKLFTHVV